MGTQKTYSSNLTYLLNDFCHVPAALDTSISGICIDSRLVQKGDLFLALSGCSSSSTDHILEAVERGANAIVAEGTLFDGRVFEDGAAVELFVDNLKEKAGKIASRFFRHPSQSMSVIGVTGTNGKTSVANYISDYLTSGGMTCGIIGTLGYGLTGVDGTCFVQTNHTTPNVVDVHRYLAVLRDQGAECVVMEVSSHGLSQGRVDGVCFEGAVFTNLSRDHLDYHGSMEAYAACKTGLFEHENLAFAVINEDDAYADEMKSALASTTELLTFGLSTNADISVSDFQLDTNANAAIRAKLNSPIGDFGIRSGLLGRFNLSNLLAVVSVAIAKKDVGKIEQRIQKIKAVDGRMEVLQADGKPTAIVDYAHTPDALKNVLEALKPHCQGRIYLVFGCGGDRDVGKRSEMAEIAETLADEVLITDDNPRNESPANIASDILSGFSQPSSIQVEHDRRLAISSTLAKAKETDVVLVAGKGHETWQEVNGVRTFFSDVEEVRRNLGLTEQTGVRAVGEVVHD